MVVRARLQLSRDPLGSPGILHEKSSAGWGGGIPPPGLRGPSPCGVRRRGSVACKAGAPSVGLVHALARAHAAPPVLSSTVSMCHASSVVPWPGKVLAEPVPTSVRRTVYRGQVSAGRGGVRGSPAARVGGARRGSVNQSARPALLLGSPSPPARAARRASGWRVRGPGGAPSGWSHRGALRAA
jgi:hypothetical protein